MKSANFPNKNIIGYYCIICSLGLIYFTVISLICQILFIVNKTNIQYRLLMHSFEYNSEMQICHADLNEKRM